MAARADDDYVTPVNPVEALVFCVMQCQEIYQNLFEVEGAENKLREMGKTLRAYAKCLSEIGMYYEPTNTANDDDESLFDDEDDE